MRLLFVVPYTPTLIRTRPYNLLRQLVRRGHAVTLVTPWESEAEQRALEAWRQAGVRVLSAPLGRPRRAANALAAAARGLPLQARYCWQPALARQLTAALNAEPFDAVHVEHLRGAEYGRLALAALRRAGARTPVVWDSVDCISLLFEQAARHSRSAFGRWMSRLELPATRRYEARAVRAFPGVLVTSPNDRDALCALAYGTAGADSNHRAAGQSHVRVLPNGVDTDYFAPAGEVGETAQVVLTGKMSYHANVTAALHLANDIMPQVWSRRPDVELVIAGSAPPPAVRRLAQLPQARVVVTGHVDDLRPYLTRAAVAAAPVTYGAGIQNKVLEAMACGVPVVASPQASWALGAEPGRHLLVADTAPAFAEALLSVLEDARLRQQLGTAGRDYVVAQHGWDMIASQLEGHYHELIGVAAQSSG